MSLHSRISASVSPLLWLAPLPFALAMCLPVTPRMGAEPASVSTVTTAQAPQTAASAPRAAH